MKKQHILPRAQEGMQAPPQQMMGYPGAQDQQQQEQVTEDQLIQLVMQDISQDLPKAAIVQKVMTIAGLELPEANQYVEQVYAALQSKMDEAGEADAEDEEVNELEGQMAQEQPAATSTPMQPIQGYTDLAMEDDEGLEEDLTSLDDEDMMRYGGQPMMQQGGNFVDDLMLEQMRSVYYPGMANYLPEEPYYMDEAAQLAWQLPEDTTEQPEKLIDFTQPVFNTEEQQFSLGGFKTKKGYVNNVMRLVKKQLGGNEETSSDDADPRGEDLRKNRLDAFLASVKMDGNMSIAKEEAKKQFDQAQQQFQMGMNPQMEALNQYIPEDYGMPAAQRGAETSGDFLNSRKYRKLLRKMPLGLGALPVKSLEVDRVGLFGRPKEYTVNFDESPLQQLASNPMLSGMYGYGTTSRIVKSPARLVTETVSNAVNKSAAEDVDVEEEKDNAAQVQEDLNKKEEAKVESGNAGSSNPYVQPRVTNPVIENIVQEPIIEEPIVEQPVNSVEVAIPDERKLLFNPQMKDAAYFTKNGKYYKINKFNTDGQYIEEVTDPTRIKYIKGFKPNQTLVNQYLPGNSNLFARDAFGTWYYMGKDSQYKKVADKNLIVKLNQPAGRGTKSAEMYVLESKPGVYYRKKNDGSYEKFQGDPASHYTNKKSVAVIKPTDKNYKFLDENAQYLGISQGLFTKVKEEGGAVENPFENPYTGELQRFISGGYDPSVSDITQDDIDYTDSEDTSDPYFQRGGLFKRRVVHDFYNPYGSYYSSAIPGLNINNYQRLKGATDAEGNALSAEQLQKIYNDYGNPYIKDIHVNKTRRFSGKPKDYTITLGYGNLDPTQPLITMPEDKTATTTTTTTTDPAKTITATNDVKNVTGTDPLETFTDTPSGTEGRQRPWYLRKKWEERFERDPDARVVGPREFFKDKGYMDTAKDYVSNAYSRVKDIKDKIPSSFNDYSDIFSNLFKNKEEAPQQSFSPERMNEQGKLFNDYNTLGTFGDTRRLIRGLGQKRPMNYGGELYEAQGGVGTPITNEDNAVANVTPLENNWQEIKKPDFLQNFEPPKPEGFEPIEMTPETMEILKREEVKEPGPDIKINMRDKNRLDPESSLQLVNAGVMGAANLIDRFKNKNRTADLYNDLSADNLYAGQNRRFRGDYETNTGLIGEMGSDWTGATRAKLGGSMESYNEGDEVYMTDEELEEFLRNGGQVEYL